MSLSLRAKRSITYDGDWAFLFQRRGDILHLITLLPKTPRCMICVSALFAFEFLADATRLSIRILIQRLFPLEQSKNFTVSVGELKLPLENLNIPLGYLACTARKRTFYYKRFLLDWSYIIMLRLLRGKYPSHRKNKSTFQLLYLYANNSWKGKSDLLKYLKYCLSTCRQLGRGDNIGVIKTLFPL